MIGVRILTDLALCRFIPTTLAVRISPTNKVRSYRRAALEKTPKLPFTIRAVA
jgi:hypothetical protein